MINAETIYQRPVTAITVQMPQWHFTESPEMECTTDSRIFNVCFNYLDKNIYSSNWNVVNKRSGVTAGRLLCAHDAVTGNAWWIRAACNVDRQQLS